MEAIIISVFIAGYLAITLEHSLKIDKLIPALVMMAISWALISFGIDDFDTWFDSAKHTLLSNFDTLAHVDKMHIVEETLLHHLGKTAVLVPWNTCELLITMIFLGLGFGQLVKPMEV